MNSSAYKELQLLNEIATEPSVTQRSLSKKLEMALGLTNLMIRRCINKGQVKVVNIQKNRISYLLTPQGIAEKTRLTYEYLQYSLHLYRRVRGVVRACLERVAQTGGRTILLYGVGEIAEIAYLALKEQGLTLVGAIDDRDGVVGFVGLPVLRSDQIPTLSFDCVIVSSLTHWEDGLQRLQALGVPEHKIIIIEQTGPAVRAVQPEAEVVG